MTAVDLVTMGQSLHERGHGVEGEYRGNRQGRTGGISIARIRHLGAKAKTSSVHYLPIVDLNVGD